MKDKILVVDDEPNMIELLTVNLEAAGYAVLSAPDGQEAIDLARAELPSLILLDVRLPGISGWDVCSFIKNNEQTRDIPVVFVTACARQEGLDKAQASGCSGFLNKPVDLPELIKLVNSLTCRKK